VENAMSRIAIARLALALAAPALAQSAAENTGVNSLIGVAPRTEDFVAEATTSDMFEIESSKLRLSDKKAGITGGDSCIRRAFAIALTRCSLDTPGTGDRIPSA
jgi:hypothetical protein